MIERNQETRAELNLVETTRPVSGLIINRYSGQAVIIGNHLRGDFIRIEVLNWQDDKFELAVNLVKDNQESDILLKTIKTGVAYNLSGTPIFIKTLVTEFGDMRKPAFLIDAPRTTEIVREELLTQDKV